MNRYCWIVFFCCCWACHAQQAPDNFRWVDFHSPKDQDVVVWVTRSLAVEDWTAIREIAVEYDAALVVTTRRATPQSTATADTFTVWTASLINHSIAPLVKGVNLRWLDWMRFADGAPEELAATYDNCRDCTALTYFTAFHFDVRQHAWTARWMHGGQGVPLWSANTPPGMEWTQVYAALAEPNGRELIATWSHFDYDNKKPSDDVVYRYDLDPMSGLERTLPLIGADARRDGTAPVQRPGRGSRPGARAGLGAVQATAEAGAAAQAGDDPAGEQSRQTAPPGARH